MYWTQQEFKSLKYSVVFFSLTSVSLILQIN